MKKLFTIFLVCLVAVVSVSCNSKIPNNENTLEIYAIEAGYGIEWLKELIEVFKEENPDLDVYLWTDIGVERGRLMLQSGPSNTTADLLFTTEDYYDLLASGKNAIKGYDYILADLTDVYESKVPGEDILFKDKMFDKSSKYLGFEVETDIGYETKNFVVPWQYTPSGLIYNDAMFKELNLKVPNTTIELLEVSDAMINQHNKIPFVSSLNVGYWGYVSDAWWQQYETIDAYTKFWNPRRPSDISNYDQKGRIHLLQMMDQILNPTYKRSHPNTIEYAFTESQAKFVVGEGLMIPNGSWFYNEMHQIIDQAHERGVEFEPKMMKTPIISALSDKLSYWTSDKTYDVLFEEAYSNGNTASKNLLVEADHKLSAIIDFVDGSGERPSDVTDLDISIVREARKVQMDTGTGATAIVPAYSNAIPAAKRFLQFMATDRAIEIVARKTSGGILPFTYDYENSSLWNEFNDFTKSTIKIALETESGPHWSITEGYWRVGIRSFLSGGVTLFANTGNSYMSPRDLFEKSKMSEQEFNQLLRNAGLI